MKYRVNLFFRNGTFPDMGTGMTEHLLTIPFHFLSQFIYFMRILLLFTDIRFQLYTCYLHFIYITFSPGCLPSLFFTLPNHESRNPRGIEMERVH